MKRLLILLAACGPSHPPAAPAPAGPAPYQATIRWTGAGVPHIIADDLGGLGFGQGFAAATLDLCRLADQFVRVRSERAKYFGAGDDDANLDSDFFHLHIGVEAHAKDLIARESEDARELSKGWVAGYNHFVAHGQRPAACADAAWVVPIDELTLAELAVGLATTASSRQFETQIARAAPGSAGAALPDVRDVAVASNGWALGADRTESGHGLVLANPHFPWTGDLTFQEVHLTAKSDFDVYGAGVPGLPMLAIGFTRHHAWTHTFSSSTRFLIERLRLDGGDPMKYLRDGGDDGRIVGQDYTIDVRKSDGTIAQVSRTLYRCPFGPMLTAPGMAWDTATAWAFHDAALDAGSSVDEELAFARAQNLDDFRAALAFRGTPFLDTLYADVDGNAWYGDGSNVPDLSDQALVAWEIAKKAVPELAAAWRLGIPVVDGSSPVFDPVTDDADAPGLVPISDAPDLERRDYVFNANDSGVFTNPAVGLGPFSPLYGPTDAPSPRTLMNLRMLREGGVASQEGADGRWSRQEAAGAILSERSFTGEQLRDEVLARCQAEVKKRKKQGATLQPLCTRLAEWDLRERVDSRGAILWRELMQALAPDGVIPWKLPFDPQAPSTPGGLAPEVDVIGALERAADLLARAGFDLRARSFALGDLQHAAIGSQIAVPGGVGLDGVTNVVTWADADATLLPHPTRQPELSPSGLGKDGYPVNFGTSWLMAVDLLPEGPQADVLLTYGPGDQLAPFAAGTLRPALFDADAIAADPDLKTVDVIQDQP